MKIVFLCPNVPYPPVNGGHHRNFGLIRALARFASVHVLAVGDPRDVRTEATRAALAPWGATLEAYLPTGPGLPEEDEEGTQRLPDAAAHFRSPQLAAALDRHLASERVDVAHVEEVVMAQYLDRLPCPRVIDRQKVDWAYHEAMAEVAPALALTHRREAARFRWWERRLTGAFDRILVPGVSDQRLLEPLHGPGRVSVVPIGIGDDLTPPAPATRGVSYALLYGARDYGPNVEAQAWFFRHVWPEVSRVLPDLKVLIVGSGRPPLGAALPPADARVELRGFVPEVATVLRGPGVLVVPVHVGGGARTKVIEALACGMPVVSSGLGVENLDLTPERDFLLAETPAETVGAIVRLAGDPELAARLGRAGADRAEPFRWSRIEGRLEPIYKQAAQASRARGSQAVVAANDTWDLPAEVSHLQAELAELRRATPARATRWMGRAARRLRRSGLAARTEVQIVRLLERVLAPPRNGAAPGPIKRGLAQFLARLSTRG